jgi:hypothetical protein
VSDAAAVPDVLDGRRAMMARISTEDGKRILQAYHRLLIPSRAEQEAEALAEDLVEARAEIARLREAAVESLASLRDGYDQTGGTNGDLYTGVGFWLEPGHSGFEQADRIAAALTTLALLSEAR